MGLNYLLWIQNLAKKTRHKSKSMKSLLSVGFDFTSTVQLMSSLTESTEADVGAPCCPGMEVTQVMELR